MVTILILHCTVLQMAAGQLLLCGHAGLTQVSPVDLRKVSTVLIL